MRFRLICDERRWALVSELLASRGLGPVDEGSFVLVELGMDYEDAAALVFDPERLEALPALLDAFLGKEEQLDRAQDPPPGAERGSTQSIALRLGDRIELVPLKSVLFFEAEGQSVRCFAATSEGEVRERLYELEERLPGSRFARVSKSAIVNLGAVREVHPWFGRSLLLRFGVEGRQVEVSRNYVGVLKDRLGI
jgi:DNA-binding LytR/AlgR family response regulator